MKQIFNWTIGSFFRSIGRILAYIIIGGFIAYLIGASGFDIKSLFFTKVHASTYSTFYKGSMTYKDLGGSTTNSMTLSNDGLFSRQLSFDSNNLTRTWWAYFPSNQSLSSNSKSIIFNLKLRMNSVNSYDISLTESQYTCTITNTEWSYYQGTNGDNTGDYDHEFEYKSFKCASHDTTGYADLNEHKFSINLYYIYNNNDNLYVPCNAIGQAGDTYTFSCPITTDNISGFRIAMSSNMASTMTIGFPALYTIENDSTQTIIDNQNQMHDTITDTNTTSDTESTSEFFHDTNSTSAEGSLQGIVSAPLSIINNLITDGTSTPLCFTLNSKQTCIPDGSIIWSNSTTSDWFSGGSKNTFISFFNLVVGGFLVYKMLMSLYRMVDDMLNPTSSRIEVMRL